MRESFILSKEQRKINRKNHRLAWEHFYPEGNGKAKPGYNLHHIDVMLSYNDVDRYIQWNIDDLVMMEAGEHTALHLNLRYSQGINNYSGKTNDELKEIADKKRKTWNSHPHSVTEKFREECSERAKGENNPMYGIPCTYKMNEEEIKSWKDNISKAFKGMKFWNNGSENTRALVCPGPEWQPGRLPKKKQAI